MGIDVSRDRISARTLAWPGSRCWTNTYPIPVLSGKWRNNSLIASSPPAEAPMPTMAKGAAFAFGSSSSEVLLAAGAALLFALFFPLFSDLFFALFTGALHRILYVRGRLAWRPSAR